MKLTIEEMASIREDFVTASTIYPPETNPEQFIELLFDAMVINIDGITDRWFEELRARIDREAKAIVVDEVVDPTKTRIAPQEVDGAVPLPAWDD
jgi:hypothetical protein